MSETKKALQTAPWRIGVDADVLRGSWQDKRDCVVSCAHAEDTVQITFRRPRQPPSQAEVDPLVTEPLLELCRRTSIDLPERRAVETTKQRLDEARQTLETMRQRRDEVQRQLSDPGLIEQPDYGERLLTLEGRVRVISERMSEQGAVIDRLARAVSDAEAALQQQLHNLSYHLSRQIAEGIYAQRAAAVAKLVEVAAPILSELILIEHSALAAGDVQAMVAKASAELQRLAAEPPTVATH